MYKIEIFDTNMDYVSACYTDDSQAISLDYLAFDPFQLTIQLVDAKKGYFAHITDDEGNLIGDCIISDVKPQKSLQNVSLRPIQAIFDREVFYSPVSDAITWIATNLDDVYVSTSDVLQKLPLNITYTVGSRLFPLTGYNLNPTINILSVITNAFATWDVVANAWMDLVNKEIRVDIFEQTATQTIECDLENIVSSEVTLGDSYGSTNKLTIKKTVAEGTPSGTTEITYYLHTDGTIDTTDSDRITPVFFDAETLEQTDEMTDADWIAETEVMAKEKLTPAQYDNEVVLMVWGDDKIINPRDIELGTITTLHIKGEVYYSILTGVSVEGGMFTLTFGAVRTELTKKLSIEKRNGGSTRISGGGGGGAGGESSVLYFYNRTVSVASNAEILRITNSGIDANTVVLECTFADPSAISGTVTWTSYDGYISFVGTCTSSTTANVTVSGIAEGDLEYMPKSGGNFTGNVTIQSSPIVTEDKIDYSYPISGGSVSCANNTNTVLGSISLPKGTSLIQMVVSFSTNATGYRKVFLSTSPTLSTDIGVIGAMMSQASSVGDTVLNGTFIINHTGDNPITYYVGGIQTSGATISAFPRVKILTFERY